ncbi:MAG: type II CRISPR-associated endonuclease Cas1 [Paludibacteraceae bacterium]|nr:type II CRISPR-associated endonuclease Cas1 [Paludibacteraceae bacterium]
MKHRTICIENPSYLSLNNGQMVIKRPIADGTNEVAATIPVEDINILVLDNKHITITQGLLDALTTENVTVVTCNSSHLPCGLLLPLSGNTLQSERYREQLNASLPLKKQLWQQTVVAKIENQAALLHTITGKQQGNMLAWAKEVKSGDSTNMEGRAAAYYWKTIFEGKIESFVRNREGLSPNDLLNYGYSIIRAQVARSLVACGLMPTLGLHHQNRYNAYCLADDIMEPYRPYVDRIVAKWVNQSPFLATVNKQTKADMLMLDKTDVIIDGHRSPLHVAISTTTSSLQKCFAGEIRKIIYPELEVNEDIIYDLPF